MKKITKIELENYRAYKDTFTITEIDNVLVLIGKNDIGKTSILEAIHNYAHKKGFHTEDLNDITKPFKVSLEIDNSPWGTFMKDKQNNMSKTYKKIKTIYFPATNVIRTKNLNNDLPKIKGDIEARVDRFKASTSSSLLSDLELMQQIYSLLDEYSQLSNDTKIDIEQLNDIEEFFDYNSYLNDLSDTEKDILDYICKKIREYSDDEEIQVKLYDNMKSYQFESDSVKNFCDYRKKKIDDNSLKSNYDSIKKEAEDYINNLATTNNVVNNIKDIIKDFEDCPNIKIGKRGSGVKRLTVLYYLMAKERLEFSVKSKDLIFLIDEPEMSLYPSQQRNLIKNLKEISKNHQVIVATHSPSVVKEFCDNDDHISKLDKYVKIIKKGESNAQKPEKQRLDYLSINEINHIVFEEPSTEYHQELFGYIQNKVGLHGIEAVDDFLKDSLAGKPNRNPIRDSGNWYHTSMKRRNRRWVQPENQPESRTLPYCVRNYIDHPFVDKNVTDHDARTEHNRKYYSSDAVLEKSIELMIEVINANKARYFSS